MKNNKIALISILFGLIILISLYFDSEIVKSISLIRNESLNEFFTGLTYISSAIIIFIFITALFLFKNYKRKFIFPVWLTLAGSFIISFILKTTIQRLRPYQLGIVEVFTGLEKISHNVWDFSFPSFSAMLVFSVLPLICKESKKLKYVWIVFAILVAFSRVYFGVHFLSDVLVGGLIGYLIGLFVIKLENDYKFAEKINKKIFGR